MEGWRWGADMRKAMFAIVLLASAVIGIYGQVATFDFLNWDDPTYVTENYDVLGGLTWDAARWAIMSTSYSNWHPLAWLSHQAAWSAFGPWAGGHHLVNAALHLANVVLCYAFFRRTTGAHWRSLLVALIYAVHPLHVETVAWISDRKALLAAFFWWLALLAWAEWVMAGRPRAYFSALLMHACALMAKPMAVSFPFVLLALDVWPLGRSARRAPVSLPGLIAEKLPFVALAIVDAGLTYYAQNASGAVVSADFLPFVDRVTNALVSYQDYVLGLFWPVGQSFFYVYDMGWPVWRVMLALCLVVALITLAWANRSARPWLLAGIAWFTIMLGPVIGLVQVGSQSHADRYMYLTDIGLIMAIVWSLPILDRARARVVGGLLAAMLLALALVSIRQTSYWRDSPTLYTEALRLDPRNYAAHLLLSEHLIDTGVIDAAEFHAQQALTYNYGRPVVIYGNRVLGRVALARGDLPRASTYLQRSLALMPIAPKTAYYKARLEFAAGRHGSGEQWLLRSLQSNPRFPPALELLATYYAERNRWADAVAFQERAARLRPWLDYPAVRLQWYRDQAQRARTPIVPPL